MFSICEDCLESNKAHFDTSLAQIEILIRNELKITQHFTQVIKG